MSDERLRELERRWKETNAAPEEAALLLERVRVGDLEQTRLEMAASLGHEASKTALGSPPEEPSWTWTGGIDALDRETRVRFALAMARAIVWSAPPSEFDSEAEAAIRAVQEWLRCPCHEHAVSSSERVGRLPLDAIHRKRRHTLPAKAVVIAYHVLIGLHDSPQGVLDGLDPSVFSTDAFTDLVGAAKTFCDEPEIRSAVCADLVPHLLGSRVETRQPEAAGE